MNWHIALLGIVLAGPVSGHAQSVLPDSGTAYSPDSSLVAFVRSTPGRQIATGIGDVEATELWIARRDGSSPRRVLVGHASDDMRFVLAGLHNPSFSADDSELFVLSSAWATSDALHVVNLRTLRQRYVAPASSLEIVRRGTYRGCLLVEQHRYWMAGGSYDWLWLITTTGHDIAPVADTDTDDFDARLTEWRKIFASSTAPKRRHPCAAPPDAH